MAVKARTLPEGHEEITTRKVRRIQPKDPAAELPIDAWILTLNREPRVQRLIITKQIAGGRHARLPQGNVDPPFEVDLDKLYTIHGDGSYRFSVLGEKDSGAVEYLTHRQETVTGYGRGQGDGAAAGSSAASTEDQLQQTMQQINETIRLKRLRYLGKTLDVMTRELEEDAAGPPVYPVDEGARVKAEQDALDRDLRRMEKLMVLTRGSDPAGAAIPRLLEKVLEKAVDHTPADRTVEQVTKLMDLADSLSMRRGPAEPVDLTQLLIIGLLGFSQHPEFRAFVGQLMRRVIPTPPGPAPAPAAAAPGAPAGKPAPSSPADGAPGTPSPEQQQAEAGARILGGLIWPIVRRGIELNAESFDSYGEICDNHMPGFLDRWAAMELPQALEYLVPLDPEFLRTDHAREWLTRFHGWAKESSVTPS